MTTPTQLRIAACDAGVRGHIHWQEYMADAADEIERLLDEVAVLRAALEHISRECDALNKGPVAVHIARAALEAGKP